MRDYRHHPKLYLKVTRIGEHTHIVRWYFQSSQYGTMGWDSRSEGFDTYEEARAAFEDEKKRPRGWSQVELLHIYRVEGATRRLDTLATVRRPRRAKK